MAREKLLLHVCCGPCSIMPVKRLLAENYEPVLWFMNPNIQPLAEYMRRRVAAGQCAARLGVAIIYADDFWDLPQWLSQQLPRAETPRRCEWCCGSRLQAAWEKARTLGFEFFSSSLLYSRYQPHDFIARKGAELSGAGGPKFIYRDFREDWDAGIACSRAWDIYRQPYCGCVFSEAERYLKKFNRLRKGEAVDVF